MDWNEPISEEDLACLLPDDPPAFMEFLLEDYGEKIAAWIGRSSYDVLDTAEVEDALQETLIGVWETISETGFVRERPLRMVFRIARNKAIDAYRKKLRFQRNVVVDSDLTDVLIADMQGSDLSFAWKYADDEQKRRLPEVLTEIVAALPPRQKAALLAFQECYLEIRARDKHRLVADAMGVVTGRLETVAAAKSALRAGLEKVREELVRQRIGFVEGRDQ